MTVTASDLADALRWLWIAAGLVWVAYAWLHRTSYGRTVLGVGVLILLDLSLHSLADLVELPDSNFPSDYALYTVVMLAAGAAGLAAACLYARARGMPVLPVIDAGLVCAIGGGIGGRLYQVGMHWDFYAENRAAITDLTQGGFGMRGALILGLIALAVFAGVTHRPFWKLADAAALGLALAQSIGWYGAALTHTHYGIALDASPLPPDGGFAPLAQAVRAFGYTFAQDIPDSYNVSAPRIPVQTLASLIYLGLFLVLVTLAARRAAPGTLWLWYWLAVSTTGLVLSFWRGDETLWWNGLRVDQWIDLGIFSSGLALALLQRGRLRPRVEQRVIQHA